MTSGDQCNGFSSRVNSGKTPPPAPSVFAKRARELEAKQGIGDNGDLPPANYPAGFGRAKAGTLPSNVQLAAQRFAAASSTLRSSAAAAAATVSTDSFQEQLQRQSFAPPASTAPVRPGLRHSASVASSAASSALTERNSRLRSGSLTLPSGGLSNAFGSSLFSSTWMPSRNGGMPVLDDLRSVTSMDSGADDFDVHTLDYLGLDETLRHPPAATISELRNQAQAAIAGNLAANPSRLRATTVSNPYRPSAGASLLATPSAEEEEELYDERMYGRQSLNAYQDTESDYLSAAYMAKGFKQSDHLSVGLGSRPRAISVGNLDDTTRALQARRQAAAEAQAYNDLSIQTSLGGIPRADKANARVVVLLRSISSMANSRLCHLNRIDFNSIVYFSSP
ncbi:uncharacterized protein B0H18DRAFT_1121438 [Fomitopsis serialis]|uniref:uncharacterized protein n=1 Tax=Fomitopsis serialis TaxID=139415 RepID=UPI002007C69B|nr:uncharacterized protein B0H18DRAFT_1121438 [Neoantrodia serialis]KAH9921286.1 hypothetical protein B0H18DRAFT_1121438 [Neoantrodia serialis]